jgi:hypothetical protein
LEQRYWRVYRWLSQRLTTTIQKQNLPSLRSRDVLHCAKNNYTFVAFRLAAHQAFFASLIALRALIDCLNVRFRSGFVALATRSPVKIARASMVNAIL